MKFRRVGAWPYLITSDNSKDCWQTNHRQQHGTSDANCQKQECGRGVLQRQHIDQLTASITSSLNRMQSSVKGAMHGDKVLHAKHTCQVMQARIRSRKLAASSSRFWRLRATMTCQGSKGVGALLSVWQCSYMRGYRVPAVTLVKTQLSRDERSKARC